MINTSIIKIKNTIKIALLENDYEKQDRIWQLVHNFAELVIYKTHRDYLTSEDDYDFTIVGIEQHTLSSIAFSKMFKTHDRTGFLLGYSFNALCPYEINQIKDNFDFYFTASDLDLIEPTIVRSSLRHKFVA